MKFYLTIAESLGIDGKFTSKVYPAYSPQDAGEMGSSLIADMIEKMDLDRNIDPTATWELEGDGWFYRVRWEEHDVPKYFAVDIQWDTDDNDVDLPTMVEIPHHIDEYKIADYLSDEYGFCVYGFHIAEF